jgi:hypothetical protein
MLKKAGFVLLVALAASACRNAGVPAHSEGNPRDQAIPFEHDIIDAHPPLNQWATSVGDINGDGQVDVVSSGAGPVDAKTTVNEGACIGMNTLPGRSM